MLRNLLVLLTVVLALAAAPALAQTPTPLNLSGAFNMEFWVSPTMFAACQSAGKVATSQFGIETSTPYMYAFDLGTTGVAGSSLLPVVNATYGSTVVSGGSGAGGFPANGALTSLNPDGRTYYFPALAGNALYSGDWIEATNSNAIVVGKGRTSNGGVPYNVPAATTATLTPGYYADINFVLAAGVGTGTFAVKSMGARYIQLWAVYSDSSSTEIYDFSTGPSAVVYTGGQAFYGPPFGGASNTDSDFHAVYTAPYTYLNSGAYGSVAKTNGSLVLYEFVTPRTVNPNKLLTGLSVLLAPGQSGDYATELAVLAATASPAVTSSVTLTTSVSPAGAGTMTPSGGPVPGKSTLPLTASPNSGYIFDHWTASDSAAYLANSTSPSTTLTLGTNNCTVTAVFRSTSGYTGTEIAAGGTIQLTSSGPYNYGQVVGITVSVNPGWQFTSWSATGATVWSPTAATTSLTVLNSFTLAALFSEIPYTVTTSAAPLAGGTVSYLPLGTQYINNVLTITALPAPGYQFVSWTVTGANLGANVASTTATVNNNVSLTAGFALIPYTVTVNQVTGGTITVSPSQATYYYGNTATVAAVTNSNYGFASWNVTGGTVSPLTSSQAILTVQGNVTLSANIGTGATLTVNTSQGTVVVTPSLASYPYGATVTITTSTITAGYVLDHWTLTGVGTLSNSRAVTTTLTINGNTETLTAVYITGSYVNNLNPLASDSNVGSLARPFKTIGKATGLAKAGSTIVVLQGVYHEAATLGNGGTSASPITLKANPGDRVVVDGANVIPSASGSWTPCTAVTASGNPNYANIYYTDISWNPTSVYQDELPFTWAKTPPWWTVTGGTSASVTDAVNLTQTNANYWVGSYVYMWDLGYDDEGWYGPITSYNPATHTVTISSNLGGGWADLDPSGSSWAPSAAEGDRYYLGNCLPLLNGPGQMAVLPSAGGNYRVYLWPFGGGRPDGHLIEGAYCTRFNIEFSSGASYWIIDGLESRYGQSVGIGGWAEATPGHMTIQNCVVHHNDGSGVYMLDNYYPYPRLLNNLFAYNGNEHSQSRGVCLTVNYALVQGNEFCYNTSHGIDFCCSSSSLLGNYLHDHWLSGHCDQVETFNNGVGQLFQDNLMINGLQNCMIQETMSVTFINNVSIYSNAAEFNIAGDVGGVDLEHNTALYGQWANLMVDGGSDPYNLVMHNNIWLQDDNLCWTANANQPVTTDYNLYYHTQTGSGVGTVQWLGNIETLAQFVTAAGQETHGLSANPRFANVPTLWFPGAFGSHNDYRTNRVYVCNTADLAYAALGDYLEIDDDGVARQITAINTTSGYIDFTPSDASFVLMYQAIVDWKSNTNFALDLTLQPGSPAIGKASDGGNIGASLNVPSYQARNYGVYGCSPTWWPLTPANVTQWAVVATHSGGIGDLAVTTSEGQVEPRSKAIKFQITFDSALSAATISLSGVTGVTIVSSTGSNYSSRISAAALDATGRVLTVTLTSPLPDQQWYTIAMNPATTAANGGPVRGVKSVKVGLLAGNVTGSRSVTAADVAAERNYIGAPVTPATARYDVDGNGLITAADQRLIQSLVGHSLP